MIKADHEQRITTMVTMITQSDEFSTIGYIYDSNNDHSIIDLEQEISVLQTAAIDRIISNLYVDRATHILIII